jgi:serine/threonine protein kinase
VAGGFREEADGLLPSFAAGSRVAQYRLEERVGAGGMAVVFRAWDERLDRWVALKILAPALATDEVFRRRFLREARAAAAVDDPHIIPVFEAGEAGEVLFIAMRYVPGGDAQSLVRRAGGLSLGRATAIVSSVASALDTAHGAGLVHRDVKPANILVDVRPGRQDHVYLSDFGLCRGALFWSGPSGQGQFLGTLGYAAPEQLAGKPTDGRADQYSLACSAFELLVGAPPFPREEPGAVIWAHMSEPPPPLTSWRPELPAAVDDVLARALAKEPDDRYASCGDFASALGAALDLAPSDSEAAIDLQAAGWQDESTWPSSADNEQAQAVRILAAAATVSRARRARHAGATISVRRTTRSGPATRPRKAGHARASAPKRSRRRLRLSVVPTAMLVAVLAVFGTLAQFDHLQPNVVIPPTVPVRSLSTYLGVYLPGRPAYRRVAEFTAAADRKPSLVGYATRLGEPFATSFADTLYRHGEIPLVQIQSTGGSVAAIAAGDYDIYLRLYADSVRDFGHQVVISFGYEMNAPWHSWGYTHTSASAFVAAWQRIVTIFRSEGADNATWLWTVEADRPGTGPIQSWWPGASYVSWIGIDGFYTKPSDTFNSVFASTIDRIETFTDKPTLLSNTAVVPSANQYASILNLFNGIAQHQLLGLVWSDRGDRRLESNPVAERAFRLGDARLN